MDWSCPLCDYRTSSDDVRPSVIRHATERHPAHLAEKATTADMLDALPSLLIEAALTIEAPNPDGASAKVPRPASSRVPKPVDLLSDLAPALDSSLFAGLVECSRIIWECLDDATKHAHPHPLGTPQWSSELAWIIAAWPDAQPYLDRCDFDWINDEMRTIWQTVASYAGVRSRPKYRCPTDGCGEQMHLSDGDWMMCGAGHQHPGPGRLTTEWRRKPPMSTKALSEALRVPGERIWKWRERGKIQPVREEGRTLFWLPWDVVALLYPDVVTEMNKEAAA